MRLTISLVILLLTASAGAQSLENWSEIIFQSQARSGEVKEIRITPDSVHYRRGNLRAGDLDEMHQCLRPKAKKQLNKILQALSGTNLSELESPSNKRAFDGASHSQIAVKTREDQFDHYFDNEAPHEKLAGLLKIMIKLSKD